MNISVSYYTSRGKRIHNEDSVALFENNNGLLALVADGLGGHYNGEIASRQAISTIISLLQIQKPNEDKMANAIQQASQDIFAMHDQQHPMHTTVAALWLGDTTAIAANVGDSRIYQFRNNEIIYQSLDHSVAQMAVLIGELESDKIRTSKDRNRLIRVLGDSQIPKVDSKVLSIIGGDCFLICSDGFWEAVTECDMLRTLRSSQTIHQWLELMRNIVEKSAGPSQDNHTALVMAIDDITRGDKE